jgi:hypothetical protein
LNRQQRTDPSPWNAVADAATAMLVSGSAAARTCTVVEVDAGTRPGLETATVKRYGRLGADGGRVPDGMAMDGDDWRRRGGPSAVAQGSPSKAQLHV